MKSNSVMVPEAKEAMERFKQTAASEVGVSLKQGYNGDITARQAGSIGGQMVKNVCPVRPKKFKRVLRSCMKHRFFVTYHVSIDFL